MDSQIKEELFLFVKKYWEDRENVDGAVWNFNVRDGIANLTLELLKK